MDVRSIMFLVFPSAYVKSSHFHNLSGDFGINLLKGLAQAKIIKKSVILFRVLNMTI